MYIVINYFWQRNHFYEKNDIKNIQFLKYEYIDILEVDRSRQDIGDLVYYWLIIESLKKFLNSSWPYLPLVRSMASLIE